jgi:hypothetical protein
MSFNEKTNVKILELLVKFDFFFFEYKSNVFNNKRIIQKEIEINNSNNKKKFILINPLEFLKSLKRVIRLFQFLQNNPNIQATFDVKNEYSFQLLKHLLEKNILDVKNFFQLEPYLRIDSLDNTSKAYFFFDSVLKESLCLNIIRTNKYLISEFSNKSNFKELGNYKLFANFNDSKKIAFLILLLKNIYK